MGERIGCVGFKRGSLGYKIKRGRKEIRKMEKIKIKN